MNITKKKIGIINKEMKYIIEENRINKFANFYLDERLGDLPISRIDGFIIVWDIGTHNEYETFIEYDHFDNRLVVKKDLISSFTSIFPIDQEKIKEIIKNWFETNFDVEIKYIKITS